MSQPRELADVLADLRHVAAVVQPSGDSGELTHEPVSDAAQAVAWALLDNDGVTVGAFCSYESASEHCEPTYHQIVPLYAHPPAAVVSDAARYQWLKAQFLGCDFAYEGTEPPSSVLTFTLPDGVRVSGNLDATIDAALTVAPTVPVTEGGASRGGG